MMKTNQLVLNTLPKPGDGRRIVPVDELVALVADPQVQDAINMIERVQGCETAIKQVIRTQLHHDIAAMTAVAVNKRAIDLARKRKEEMVD